MEVTEGYVRREVVLERDWTKGSIIRNLLSLSWPMIVLESLWVVGLTLDMVWVGKLGTAPIAGVGIATIVVMLVVSAKAGLDVGMRAIVARFIGAGDTEGAKHIARQALVISAAYGMVTTAIGVLLAEPILDLFGLEPDVVAEGAAYMRIMFAGWISWSIWLTAYGIMQASGDSVTPMRIAAFFRILHIPLSPLLVLGLWIFPSMGVSGAATSYIATQTLGMLIALWVLFSGRTRLQLTLRNLRLDLGIIWRIVKIGVPASVTGIQRTFGNLVFAWLMAPFGTLAVAGHSLVQRIEMLLSLPSIGLGLAAGVLVGQNLGAHQPERAERSAWLGMSFVEAFMLVASVALLQWATGVIGIFTTEPGLIELASIFLKIAVISYLVLGFTIVLSQSITCAGDTLPAMIISLAMVWVVQLPLAYSLPRVADLGVYGVRWALVAGMVMGAVAFAVYFRTGRWKRKKV